ncbi:anti-phage deoxyguanosine triphosphatase [Pseudophaeobacter sp.]|uniref:anti-phage deoxyguanosine triphosphatase n=1 Tax=Pseudophaeobacter sp. TaxID=1971739 RepID=UPI002626D56A|nr:anti-phage deoxyguanosine triphosphatase [Pseudophaeobacter sp.]
MNETYWIERQHSSPRKDHRTEWERDYARVVHSASFRRLQAKTQVLGLGDGDFYRTRLTHSMEVSQIGVSITKKLYREAKAANLAGKGTDLHQAAINHLPHPMLMSTICLAHDIGHPPFGHGGEIALNRCMLPYGGFEGNGQTLRIVTKLEKYAEGHGMNLTRRAVLGLIKYPAPFSEVIDWKNLPDGKPVSATQEKFKQAYFPLKTNGSVFVASDFKPPKCYLDDEYNDVVLQWVAKDLPGWKEFQNGRKPAAKGKHPKTKYKSLDTSIMELADDIAYGVHDLEDAIGLNLISRKAFREWFEGEDRKENLKALLSAAFEGDFDKLLAALFDQDTPQRKEAIGRMVGFFVESATFEESYPDFKEPLFCYQAVFGGSANGVRKALDVLQAVVVDLVIKSTAVQQLEFKGQKLVTELFEVFATDPKRLLDSRDFERTIQGGGSIPTARVICDYIAGMTDEYATKRYQQLFEPRVGSVFDRL